ncbi:MAG TPA: sulfite exporter TauE/SafE family protein [Azospira sp.]|nr:sulfite exporter TauE/SafE family protein [Azospira sp.]
MSEFWWAYLLLGAFAGFMAGLLGVGGGAVMVPILTTIFLAEGFARSEVVHLALGTSMAAIVFTSISSLRAHHAHGAVLWKVVRGITPGILVGTFAATFVAARAPTTALALFFAAFMSYVAVQMLLNIKPKPHRELPGTLGMSAVGVGIGGISALVAIGGGTMSVPFMTWCNVKAQHAIGTSAAIGLPIALAGTAGYLVNGWGHPGLPPATLGFIYLPALLLVVAVSMATAPLGAKLAHRLPVATLKRVFAGLLVLLVARMLWSVFGAA